MWFVSDGGCLKNLLHSWPVAVEESNTSKSLYFHSFHYRFGTFARGSDGFTLLDEAYDRTSVLCVQRGTDSQKYHITYLAFSEQERRDFTPKVLYWSWKQSAAAASTQTHIQCRQRMAEKTLMLADIQYWQGKSIDKKSISSFKAEDVLNLVGYLRPHERTLLIREVSIPASGNCAEWYPCVVESLWAILLKWPNVKNSDLYQSPITPAVMTLIDTYHLRDTYLPAVMMHYGHEAWRHIWYQNTPHIPLYFPHFLFYQTSNMSEVSPSYIPSRWSVCQRHKSTGMIQSARPTGSVTHVQINAVRNCGNRFAVIWKPLLIAMEKSGDCWLQLHYLEIFTVCWLICPS